MIKIKIMTISVIAILLFTSIVIAKPEPNSENQYYIFGDNTEAVPQLGFNWSNNETYVYPYNESLWYYNETGIAFDLGGITPYVPVGDGYAGATGHPHNQDLNTTSNVNFNCMTALSIFGDGGNITNISVVGDGYAGATGHPHNQDLNTTNNVIFNWLTAQSLFGDGGNITNISVAGDGYAGTTGHPHNQDLNLTSDVSFLNITSREGFYSRYDYVPDFRGALFLGEGLYNSVYNDSNVGFVFSGISGGANIVSSGSAKADIISDTDGIITMPYQSSARVRLRNTQTVNTVTWTRLLLNQEDYDQNNDFALYRFTAPAHGLYMVTYSVIGTNFVAGNLFQSAVYKNGVATGCYDFDIVSASGTGVNTCSDILLLSTGDYLELYVYHNKLFASVSFTSAYIYSNYMAICKIA